MDKSNIFNNMISEIKIIDKKIYTDFRGYTAILYDASVAKNLDFHIVQINQGFSIKPYTLRGMHYQEEPHAQAKLVSCLYGSIYNVAVDIRPDSPMFGKCTAEVLTAENQKSMYIPKGFAHGYLTLEPNTLMQWCVDEDFCAEAAKCLRWDSVGIPWPGNAEEYVISAKDRNGIDLNSLRELHEL